EAHARPRAKRFMGRWRLAGAHRRRCHVIPEVGKPLDRVDGRAKVTGSAKYAYETTIANPAYAALVSSAIPAGTIRSIDTSDAKKAPGVLAILSHLNAPKL